MFSFVKSGPLFLRKSIQVLLTGNCFWIILFPSQYQHVARRTISAPHNRGLENFSSNSMLEWNTENALQFLNKRSVFLITFWEARVWTSILMLPMPFWIFTFSYCVFFLIFFYTRFLNKYEELWCVSDLSVWVATILSNRSFLRKLSSV